MNIGIDFGSTYSMVSKYNASTRQAEAISFAEGAPASQPSVVGISKKGQVTCGIGAKEQIGKKTVRIFDAFKMLLTETNQDMLRRRGYVGEYTPRAITKLYLESLLQSALRRENCDKLDNVVICVPEIWGKNLNTLDGRVILRNVLRNEIDVPIGHIRVVTEPEAASAFFAYNYEQETKRSFNGHLLLIDYGGGTLDLTLTEVFSDGNGTMEIGYREGGGAGENHPGTDGGGSIGNAGIAFMQGVVVLALRDAEKLGKDETPDYTSPDFMRAVRDLESFMKSAPGMKRIEDAFEPFGSYRNYGEILEEDPADFVDSEKDDPRNIVYVEYDGDEILVTYQHLYLSYRDNIEGILREQIEQINAKVREHIHNDPCEPAAGVRDDFKIALVGGFGSFYLVEQQIAEIYRLDFNASIDRRIKNISKDKRELAISLGAALLAEGKIVLQKTARYSIGVYANNRPRYGIKYHQILEPGKPYFICLSEEKPDEPGNRVTYGGLHGNIKEFAIEFTERRDHGGLMRLKPELLKRMQSLPQEGFWNLGFSMDESDVISFHIVPRPIPGLPTNNKSVVIPLESYTKMFDLTAVREV